MIVYSSSKREFDKLVYYNEIADVILKNLRDKNVSGGSISEIHSWQNSLMFMRNVLDTDEIPLDAEVAIEYQIPRTSKRVDFMIAGADKNNKDNVVVVELKQWDKAEKVDDLMRHTVRVYTGGGNRMVSHPSYQAFAYATFIKDASEHVQKNKIDVVPCAYLHNYSKDYEDVLKDDIYSIWYDEAPIFIKSDMLKLREFILKYINMKSSTGDLLYKIDNGRIKPSKSLQDSIVSLVKGNEEFKLLDDQIVVYDMCLKMMDQCMKDKKRRSIVIEGGPGTGKSVLAINLLKDFISKGYNASYCTKNRAPRDAYLSLLTKSDVKKEVNIKSLFRSPFGLWSLTDNFYDCLIVDEAHRLVKKMFMDKGENQVKECLEKSLFTIFLIDENQRITTKDIGSIGEIEKWADKTGSRLIRTEETVLHSQFRCNGSDQFIQLINNILQIGESVDVDLGDLGFDVKVFSDPNELRDELRKENMINNKARMVAGYCYDWNVKYGRNEWDIFLENNFHAKWNLEKDNIWAINPNSFEEVGCIHTAQGLEFDYVGVFIGQDLRFDKETGKVITDKSMISKDDKSSGIRSANNAEAEILIKNTYKTLLTRGQKGCYIYCEDKDLADYINDQIVGLNKN